MSTKDQPRENTIKPELEQDEDSQRVKVEIPPAPLPTSERPFSIHVTALQQPGSKWRNGAEACVILALYRQWIDESEAAFDMDVESLRMIMDISRLMVSVTLDSWDGSSFCFSQALQGTLRQSPQLCRIQDETRCLFIYDDLYIKQIGCYRLRYSLFRLVPGEDGTSIATSTSDWFSVEGHPCTQLERRLYEEGFLIGARSLEESDIGSHKDIKKDPESEAAVAGVV